MKKPTIAALAGLFALGALLASQRGAPPAQAQPAPSEKTASPAPVGDARRANRAHELILELDTAQAAKELEGADPNDALLALERALLAIYEGRCTDATNILTQQNLLDLEPAARLLGISRGCEMTMAGATVREDAASGAWIRLQDDEDAALVPFLFEVIASAREVFQRDLGVTMPRPIRIEIARDQFGLAAMTGLPLSAARTTGTIGIAKWGRVTIVSPRATESGYSVMDTLAHELTHLALTRASRDRAPLWLQEGIARSEENQWRTPSPFDDVPRPDDLAAYGVRKNIGPEIDKIGPSIALLPSAIEAQITYAKVQSFMGFYVKNAGERALPKLLEAMRDMQGEDMDPLIARLSGESFSAWSTKWKAEILKNERELSEDDRPGAPPPKELKEVRQRYRLGELLLDRKHPRAATKELERAHGLLPAEAPVRALLARALVDEGQRDRAKTLVENVADVHHNESRWWSMRAALGVGDTNAAIRMAIALAPYDLGAACDEKAPPDLPTDPARRALCEAARRKPRGR